MVAEAQEHRVTGANVGGVPVGAVAHGGDRGLGGADQLGDLRILQLRVMAQQPGDGVRLVLTLGHGGIARSLRAPLGLRQIGLGGTKTG